MKRYYFWILKAYILESYTFETRLRKAFQSFPSTLWPLSKDGIRVTSLGLDVLRIKINGPHQKAFPMVEKNIMKRSYFWIMMGDNLVSYSFESKPI